MKSLKSTLLIAGIVVAAALAATSLFGPRTLNQVRRARAADPTPATNRAFDPHALRVLVANIRLPEPTDGANAWSERRALLLQTVLHQDADIVGFQEVSPAQASFLMTNLKDFSLVPPKQDANAGPLGALTNLVASLTQLYYRHDRWKLVESDGGAVRPEAPQDNATENTFFSLAVLHDVHGALPDLVVINTHLRHGVPNAVACAQRLHTFLAKEIKAHPGAQAIVLGDMNHDRTTPIYTALRDAGDSTELVDTFDYTKRPQGVIWGTYHNFTGKPVAGWPTDLIFASMGLTAEPAVIVTDHDEKTGKYPSDHFFVRATIRPRAK